MVAQSNDHWEIAATDQALQLSVGVFDQRTGAIGNGEIAGLQFRPSLIRRTMGGDHDASGNGRAVALLCYPAGAETFAHDRIVNKLAQNGEWSPLRQLFGCGNGIANAEADAEMFRHNNFHGASLLIAL